MNQSFFYFPKFNHSKGLAENGIEEIVLGKDKEACKERDKSNPVECIEGFDDQWSEIIVGGYDTQEDIGGMEKFKENSVKESGNEDVMVESVKELVEGDNGFVDDKLLASNCDQEGFSKGINEGKKVTEDIKTIDVLNSERMESTKDGQVGVDNLRRYEVGLLQVKDVLLLGLHECLNCSDRCLFNQGYVYKANTNGEFILRVEQVFDPGEKGGELVFDEVDTNHFKGKCTYVPMTHKGYWQLDMGDAFVVDNSTGFCVVGTSGKRLCDNDKTRVEIKEEKDGELEEIKGNYVSFVSYILEDILADSCDNFVEIGSGTYGNDYHKARHRSGAKLVVLKSIYCDTVELRGCAHFDIWKWPNRKKRMGKSHAMELALLLRLEILSTQRGVWFKAPTNMRIYQEGRSAKEDIRKHSSHLVSDLEDKIIFKGDGLLWVIWEVNISQPHTCQKQLSTKTHFPAQTPPSSHFPLNTSFLPFSGLANDL
ncbi:aspartic proteinase A1 [Tanacetum coccineum]